MPPECPPEVERQAQQIAAQLLERAPKRPAEPADLHQVDVNSLAMVRPRSLSVEAVGLWAMEQLGLRSLLEGLGFGARDRALAMAAVIARLARPGSEGAAWRWLRERSALGELLEVDFGRLSAARLNQASDALLANRDAIEAHLFERVTGLVGLSLTVTLYDLTNAFFEGEAAAQPEARRGHSREKRADSPLPALGLVLDGSGFVRRSQVFAGAVSEDTILPPRLDALGAPKGALVVMDAGGAAEANLAWLRDNGYRYLVVSRERPRRVDPDLAVAPRDALARKRPRPQAGRRRRDAPLLLVRGAGQERTKHGRALRGAFRGRTGDAQRQPVAPAYPQGARPRVGAHRAHQGEERRRWRALRHRGHRRRRPGLRPHLEAPAPHRRPAHPSRRLLPAHQHPALGRGDAVAHLRHPHRRRGGVSLAQARARPASAFHPTPKRAEGHLFIAVIAYQLVQTIRRRLAEHGERQNWAALRRVLEGQQRVTATFRQQDGRTLHVRQATRAEPAQRAIYQALGIDPAPGGIRKMVV